MDASTYHVEADWDPEAGVWVATSEDVPGLVTEAETIEALMQKLREIVPELLEANDVLPAGTCESSSGLSYDIATGYR
jgi:predicted RNase H-like HicB family nuclease